MQKVLVTGGCGYIGSHTVVDLIEKGYQPVIIDDLSNSDRCVLKNIEQITGIRVPFYSVDLKDYNAVSEVFLLEKNIECVIHFAAHKAVGESVEKPLKYYENNLIGLINLLKCQKEYDVKKFIFSSSCSVYGNAEELPVTEDTPWKRAESPYARTKQMNEDILQDFAIANQNFKIVILRYFNPAGAHESGKMGESPINQANNLVPVITETAIGKRKAFIVFGNDYDTRDGSCIRDYIHVMDLADAHTKAMESLLRNEQNNTVEIYNLGSGNGASVLEVIESFRNTTGEQLNYEIGPRRSGDVIAIYANNIKAKEKLNWRLERTIESIMATAWMWEKQRSE